MEWLESTFLLCSYLQVCSATLNIHNNSYWNVRTNIQYVEDVCMSNIEWISPFLAVLQKYNGGPELHFPQ